MSFKNMLLFVFFEVLAVSASTALAFIIGGVLTHSPESGWNKAIGLIFLGVLGAFWSVVFTLPAIVVGVGLLGLALRFQPHRPKTWSLLSGIVAASLCLVVFSRTGIFTDKNNPKIISAVVLGILVLLPFLAWQKLARKYSRD